MLWRFDFLPQGQAPYDVPLMVEIERAAGGTRMRFTSGPLHAAEHTEGSRLGWIDHFEVMAKALGE